MAEPLVRIVLEDVAGFRDERGRYTSAQSAQLGRNRLFSEFLREQVGRRMKNHIAFGKRPSHSTGRLLRVTLDDKNVIVTKEFVGVGVPTWLDRSQAKYWRTFEEGSAAVWSKPFVGTQLVGVKFGPNGQGGLSDLRTVSSEKAEAFAAYNAKIGRPGRFVVKHEIAPAGIYAEVAGASLEKIKSFGVYSARKLFAQTFGESNLIVRDAGELPH